MLLVRNKGDTRLADQRTVQASREHYCVNKAVVSKPNKEEECDKLLSNDGPSCKYYTNVSKLYGVQATSTLKVPIPCRSCRAVCPIV